MPLGPRGRYIKHLAIVKHSFLCGTFVLRRGTRLGSDPLPLLHHKDGTRVSGWVNVDQVESGLEVRVALLGVDSGVRSVGAYDDKGSLGDLTWVASFGGVLVGSVAHCLQGDGFEAGLGEGVEHNNLGVHVEVLVDLCLVVEAGTVVFAELFEEGGLATVGLGGPDPVMSLLLFGDPGEHDVEGVRDMVREVGLLFLLQSLVGCQGNVEFIDIP